MWRHPYRGYASIVVFLALLSALAGCGRSTPRPRQILLITLDTTRADHIGVYGSQQVRTPSIDALTEDSVQFDRCASSSHFTIPSHTSILTSLYLPDHGVTNNNLKLPQFENFLPKVFQSHGFSTAAIVSSRVLDLGTNFNQGFDHYDQPRVKQRRAESTTYLALDWIGQHRDEDFFLWAHYFDPHMYFDPPPPYDSMYQGTSGESFTDLTIENKDRFKQWRAYLRQSDDPEHYRNLYKGEISYMDAHLGRLFEGLKEMGLYDQVVIFLTADHGENLGDRGRYFTHRGIYNDTILVPCVLKLPDQSPTGQRQQPVSGVDIYPTLLGLAGIEVPQPVRGLDLTPLVRDPDAETSRTVVLFHLTGGKGLGLKSSGHTYLRLPSWSRPKRGENQYREELYDDRRDPNQTTDLAAERPELLQHFRELADEVESVLLGTGEVPEEITDPEQIERLKALGYL